MANKDFKTIVVGLDFSAYSKKVLDQAVRLGKYYGAPVVAVHAFTDPFAYMDVPSVNRLPVSVNRLSIGKELDNAYDLKEKGIDVFVVEGSSALGIIKAARKFKNPLIVVGHRGQSAIERFFLGSTAEALALTAPFPVWIHRGNKTSTPKRILVPHDLRRVSDAGLTTAMRFANGKAPRVEALYVHRDPLPNLYYDAWLLNYNNLVHRAKKALAALKSEFPKTKLASAKGDVVKNILKKEREFDLIVMRPHSHQEGFHPFGKITSKVIRSARGPVLVAR
jgi:nucleotide-binding universal stress UspA family protein